MQPITIQFAIREGYVRTIQISRKINIIQIDLPDGSTSALPLAYSSGRCLGYQRRLAELFFIKMIKWTVFHKNYKMDSKIGFEMSLIVVEAIHGRCASFMVLTATVSEIFGGQTNSSILVV